MNSLRHYYLIPASSAKRGKSGKKGKTPEPEPEPEPEPPSTPLPVPGSDEWEFADREISDVSFSVHFSWLSPYAIPMGGFPQSI